MSDCIVLTLFPATVPEVPVVITSRGDLVDDIKAKLRDPQRDQRDDGQVYALGLSILQRRAGIEVRRPRS